MIEISNDTPIVLLHAPAENCRIAQINFNTGYADLKGKVVALIRTVEQKQVYDNNNHKYVYQQSEQFWALVATSDNEVMDELRNSLVLANQRSAVAERERHEALQPLQDANKSLTARLTAAEKVTTSQEARYEDSQASLARATKSLRAIEGDLAKVKRHIGEKSYNDALKGT